jgi:hypothetical protein
MSDRTNPLLLLLTFVGGPTGSSKNSVVYSTSVQLECMMKMRLRNEANDKRLVYANVFARFKNNSLRKVL